MYNEAIATKIIDWSWHYTKVFEKQFSTYQSEIRLFAREQYPNDALWQGYIKLVKDTYPNYLKKTNRTPEEIDCAIKKMHKILAEVGLRYGLDRIENTYIPQGWVDYMHNFIKEFNSLKETTKISINVDIEANNPAILALLRQDIMGDLSIALSKLKYVDYSDRKIISFSVEQV